MKKLIYSIIALATLFVISCSNEDIEIVTKNNVKSVKCNVDVLELYKTFGVADNLVDKYLRDRSGAIGIYAYLYDNNGNAVDSILQTTFTTSTASLTFNKIEGGQYTLVLIETLVNPDDGNKPDAWNVINSKKLSTLAIKQIDIMASPYDAVGAKTLALTVSDKDLSINVVPDPLGSRINYYSRNVENFNVAKIGFGTTDILDQYKLDPMLRESDRYVVDLSQKGKFNLRCSLTKEKILDGYHNLSYVLEDEIEWIPCYQTEGQVGTTTWSMPTQKSTVKLESGKTYYAVFYYLDKLNTMAWDIFESVEEANNFITECEERNVSSEPGDVLYFSPYTNWNSGTVSAVKNYMSKYSLKQDITADEDGNYNMVYMDEEKDVRYLYSFKTSSSGLTDSYVILDANVVTTEQVKRHLTANEKYQYQGTEDGTDFYSNGTTSIIVWTATANGYNYLYVNYYNPASYTRGDQNRAKAVKTIKKRFEKSVPSNGFKREPMMVTMQAVPDNYVQRPFLFEKDK